MSDTKRTLAALQLLLASGELKNISAQDVRDFLISVHADVGYGSDDATTAAELKDAVEGLIDSIPDDDSVSGIKAEMVFGESIVFPNVLYQKADGKLYKADADAAATMPVMFLALESGVDTETKEVLLFGFVRDDGWSWIVGGLIYASGTEGELTQTAPSAVNSQVQIVGIATHANRILFKPDSLVLTTYY
ncbi:MAG: hypothetical protein ABII90_10225 [Bacteroidota bacterium]